MTARRPLLALLAGVPLARFGLSAMPLTRPALAQSGQSLGTLVPAFLKQLEPVLPGVSARYNGKAAFDDWVANPWTRGAYSYYAVGQYTAFGGAEAARSGNCHFAGEHTSTDSQGYLNGAVESGERAAKEILADVKAA